MNNSGDILPSVLHRYGAQPEDLVIVVDNMDLPPGACRIRHGGGHAGHNGLKSAAARLETTDFLRLYVGVGRPEKGTTVVDHVLGEPSASDFKAMDEAMNRAVQALNKLRYMPLDRVAEELNRRN